MPVEQFANDLAACRRTARLGLLVALAAALYVVEAQLPALPLPGARLGLANLVTVLVLYGWGLREALWLGVLRQVLGGALTGTLFGMPFYFGIAGAMFSALVMALVLAGGGRHAQPVLVSLAGAVAHNLAQLGVAYLFIRQPVVLAYLPYLLYFALPAGAVVGFTARLLLPVMYEEISWLDAQTGVATGIATRVATDVAADSATPANRVRLPLPAHSRKKLVWDLASVLLVAALGLGGYIIWRQQTQPVGAGAAGAAYARVTVNGAEVARLPLDHDTEYEVPLKTGHMKIVVQDGAAAIVEATCPDQICVRTGKVQRPGQGAVCVPNKVTLTIASERSSSGPDEVDAITW